MTTTREPIREESWVTFADLMAPLRRRWRLVAGLTLGAAAAAGGLTAAWPRPYEATAVLATVGGGNSLGSLGQLAGAAAAFGGGRLGLGKGDLSPTPDLVSALLTSRRVLTGAGQAAGPGGVPLVEALTGKKVGAAEIPQELKEFVRTDIGAQTGLVTLAVAHRDSGLTRRLSDEVIAQMTRAFVDAARSQARSLRIAQEARLDSAKRQLARAETSYRDFLRGNRSIADYSVQSVERDRLMRDVEVARQVFMQATADRESAVARELQETPAVVVLDPAPADLPRRPRQAGLKMLLAALAGLLIGVLVVYLRESGAPVKATA